jgi:hypothetical protein
MVLLVRPSDSAAAQRLGAPGIIWAMTLESCLIALNALPREIVLPRAGALNLAVRP